VQYFKISKQPSKSRQLHQKKEKKYFIEIVTTVPNLPLSVFIGIKSAVSTIFGSKSYLIL